MSTRVWQVKGIRRSAGVWNRKGIPSASLTLLQTNGLLRKLLLPTVGPKARGSATRRHVDTVSVCEQVCSATHMHSQGAEPSLWETWLLPWNPNTDTQFTSQRTRTETEASVQAQYAPLTNTLTRKYQNSNISFLESIIFPKMVVLFRIS